MNIDYSIAKTLISFAGWMGRTGIWILGPFLIVWLFGLLVQWSVLKRTLIALLVTTVLNIWWADLIMYANTGHGFLFHR